MLLNTYVSGTRFVVRRLHEELFLIVLQKQAIECCGAVWTRLVPCSCGGRNQRRRVADGQTLDEVVDFAVRRIVRGRKVSSTYV